MLLSPGSLRLRPGKSASLGRFDPLSLNPILAYEASRSMLAAATNLVTNTDFSNWDQKTSSTLTDGSGYLGQPSKIFEASGATHRTFRTPPLATTAGTTYTGSFWIRRVSGTGTIQLYHQYSAQGNLTNITSDISGEWTRVERTFTGNASSGDIWFGIWVNVQGDSVEIAMPQVEEGSVATSFTNLVPSASNLGLVAALENQVSGGANATQTTATYQPRAHVPVGAGHLYLSGVSGNYASVPDASSAVSGDFTLQVDNVSLIMPQPSTSMFISKDNGGGNRSFRWGVETNRTIQLVLSSDGSAITYYSSTASLDTGTFEGSLRVIRDGSTITFFTDTGAGFVQFGDALTDTTGTLASKTFDWGIGASSSGAFPTLGTLGRARIWNTATPDVSTPILDSQFSVGEHKASSFTCASGQTVTINKSGNDPATIVRRNFLRFDGASSFLTGSFNESNTTGGYMFVVYSVNGDGGQSSGRVFVMNSAGEAGYSNVRSFLWSLRKSGDNNIAYYHNQSWRGIHTLGFDPVDGVLLHEVKAVDGEQFSKVNNGDIQTSSLNLSSLSSEEFDIGSNPYGSSNYPAIDIEALYLFDHTLTDDDANKIRDYLNAKSSIY